MHEPWKEREERIELMSRVSGEGKLFEELLLEFEDDETFERVTIVR